MDNEINRPELKLNSCLALKGNENYRVVNSSRVRDNLYGKLKSLASNTEINPEMKLSADMTAPIGQLAASDLRQDWTANFILREHRQIALPSTDL